MEQAHAKPETMVIGDAPPAGPPVPSKLANRSFILLWQGQTISQFGNQAYIIAMTFWLLRATGSASLMALLMVASTLPGVLLSPFGGTLADRLPRIRIVIVGDLINGGAILVASLALMETMRPRVIVPLLCAVAIVDGVVRAFFQPAVNAAIPDLVPASRLNAANSLSQFSGQAAAILGQSLGGVLYNVVGVRLLFLFDALTFFLSAGCSSFIRQPARPRNAGSRNFREARRQFTRETMEGFAFVRRQSGLLGFMIAAAGFNFFVMPVNVLLPFYVELYLHAGAEWYGFLVAAVSGGAILGFLAAGLIRLHAQARGRFIVGLLMLAPTPFLAIGLVVSKPLALAMAVLLGAFVGMINVYSLTILQAATPPELRGRVMGLVGTLSGGLIPAGMVLGGVAGDLTGRNVPAIYVACGLAALIFTAVLVLRPQVREFLAREYGEASAPGL
jgi:DHA3 family macrolide efflux protein-like MFS transporter